MGAAKRAESGAVPDQLIYVRIADTLRESILSGQLPPGHRLPSEAELGRQFGASRTSIREALRVLVSQRLIDTSRGATGGSTVRQLDHLEVIDILKDNIRSLMIGRGSTHDEMEEVRELLEVSATWVAARRRTEEQLARIASCIAPVSLSLPPHEQTQLKNLVGDGGQALRTAFAYWLRVLRWKSGIGYIGEPSVRYAGGSQGGAVLRERTTKHRMWLQGGFISVVGSQPVTLAEWNAAQAALSACKSPPVWFDFLFDSQINDLQQSQESSQ